MAVVCDRLTVVETTGVPTTVVFTADVVTAAVFCLLAGGDFVFGGDGGKAVDVVCVEVVCVEVGTDIETTEVPTAADTTGVTTTVLGGGFLADFERLTRMDLGSLTFLVGFFFSSIRFSSSFDPEVP